MSRFTGNFKNINSYGRNIGGCKESNKKVNKYGLKLSTVHKWEFWDRVKPDILENMPSYLIHCMFYFWRLINAWWGQNMNKIGF